MLEGRCPKCGLTRYGWALVNPRYQACSSCGVGLEISENGHRVMTGFSPFEAERIDVNKPEQSPAPPQNPESS
jgi:hypothetical protein